MLSSNVIQVDEKPECRFRILPSPFNGILHQEIKVGIFLEQETADCNGTVFQDLAQLPHYFSSAERMVFGGSPYHEIFVNHCRYEESSDFHGNQVTFENCHMELGDMSLTITGINHISPITPYYFTVHNGEGPAGEPVSESEVISLDFEANF